MRLLVSGTTKSLRKAVAVTPECFGFLTSPAAGNKVATITSFGLPWAIDNGAYTGFDALQFHLLMVRGAYADQRPEWVACPDVVGDAKGTIAMFGDWQAKITSLDLQVAFVGQDGQEDLVLPPWEMFRCFFVGGSTKWKLSQSAADLVATAKAHGKWVHMGRVNSRKRLAHAIRIGCDSVDGTGMSKWGDRHLLKFARWLKLLKEQPYLVA